MITFITGVPGAGKTLNTLKMVNEEWGKSDRPIYYRGIRELKLPWEEITDEQVKEWYNLPDGSVLVVDECQQIFPNRSANRPVPDGVARLDTHRHRGFDFYFLTQKPTMVDFGLRGFAGRHFHFERGYNREATRKLEWQKAVDKPDDYHTRQEAQTTRVKFDKKYYDLYKSAEVHTHKPRIPRAFWFFIAACLGTATFGAVAYNSITERTEDAPQEQTYYDEIGHSGPIRIGAAPDPEPGALTMAEYASQWTPRIPDIPHSAPVFDELTVVKQIPRPQCMLHIKSNACQCFTQQATPLDLTHDTCMNIVKNGWFNPFAEDGEPVGRRDAPPGHRPETPPQPSHQRVVMLGEKGQEHFSQSGR